MISVAKEGGEDFAPTPEYTTVPAVRELKKLKEAKLFVL